MLSSRARRIRPWAAAGLGIHLLQYQPEVLCHDCGGNEPVSFGSSGFTTAVARAQFFAGLDYAIAGRLTVFGAVRVDTTFLPEDDDIATQRKVYAGLRLRF